MAQPPQTLRSASHGRGGAGNINAKPNSPTTAPDLTTPTIKSKNYTTGRGGTGNMATNDPANPSLARAAQDVEAPAAHDKAPQGTFHWGRGGEGNMMNVGGGEAPKKERTSSKGAAERQKPERRGSLQEAVKGMLGLGHKEKKGDGSPVLVEEK